MPYVYSTATCSTNYCEYAPTDDKNKGHAVIRKKVLIQGGHGIASQFHNGGMGHIHTPKGVATEVSEEDLEFLLQDKNFIRHMEAGFITVDKKKVDPAKRAENMKQKDGSAPLTP